MHEYRVGCSKPKGRKFFVARVKEKTSRGWRDITRQSTECEDRAQAEAYCRELEQKLNSRQEPRTLADVVRARIQSLDKVRGGRAADTFRVALRAVEQFADGVSVDCVDRTVVLKIREGLQSSPGRAGEFMSPSTVKNRMAAIAAAWRWAQAHGKVKGEWPRLPRIKLGPRRKRGFTDAEVSSVLTWVSRYHDGRYLAAFSVLADTGSRSREILKLKGRDIQRQACEIVVRQKGGQTKSVPIPPGTMALIPEAGPDEYVFRSEFSRKQEHGHVRAETILEVLGKATEALGIPDRERLDVHSFRRAFVAACERENIPTDVGRRITGHKTRAMWDHYQQEHVGDNLHDAVRRVKARRQCAQNVPKVPKNDQSPESSKSFPGRSLWPESNRQPSHYEGCQQGHKGLSSNGLRNQDLGSLDTSSHDNTTTDSLVLGAISPVVARLSRWFEESPEDFVELLNRPDYQQIFRKAYESFVARKGAGQRPGTVSRSG